MPCPDCEKLIRERDELRGLLDNEREYTVQYKAGAQAYKRDAEAAESTLARVRSWAENHDTMREVARLTDLDRSPVGAYALAKQEVLSLLDGNEDK